MNIPIALIRRILSVSSSNFSVLLNQNAKFHFSFIFQDFQLLVTNIRFMKR